MKQFLTITILFLLVNSSCKQALNKKDFLTDTSFYIVAPSGKTCLDLTNNSVEKNTIIMLDIFKMELTQQWKLERIDSTCFLIKSRCSNLVIDRNVGWKDDRTILKQVKQNGSDDQKWIIRKKGDYYTIMNLVTGKYITNPANSDEPYVVVMIYPELEDGSQLWDLRAVE